MLCIGIASYNNAEKLPTTIELLKKHTTGEWKLLIVDNASPDPEVRRILEAEEDPRVQIRFRETNVGYAGAVNEILDWADTPLVAYCDNDAWVQSHAWNEALARILETHHEVAMAFPNGGTYPLQRPRYTEVLWGGGHFWMLKKARYEEIGGFDTEIGHQEEVDFQTRLRLQGWKIAQETQTFVQHFGVASTDPAARERINNGIIRWVNKWVAYFGGKHLNYYSPNVIRFADWPVNALYMEEWFQSKGLGAINDNPERIVVEGVEFDLIKVPRFKDLYRGRVI